MIKAVTNSLLSIAFPQHCHICRGPVEERADGIACASCWAATRIFDEETALCSKCGNILPSARNSTDLPCGECTDHYFDKALAGGAYEQALAAIVLELKRTPHLPERARGIVLWGFERAAPADVDLLIPVPLSPKRRIERGFNQAEVIGQFVSDRTGVPFDASSLVRHKHTPMHRVAMDSKARELTVKNAFDVVRPLLIQGRSVLLIDDVLTTGSTASYCAKELKKNGAADVSVLTLARAVRSYN